MASREGEFLVDLECGGTGTTSEDEGPGAGECGDVVSGGRRPSNRGTFGARFTTTNNVINVDKSDSFSELNDFGGAGAENSGGGDVRDLAAILENRIPSPIPHPHSNDQRKKHVPKNATKPPRPPKGPLLTASDLKLVKEFSEIAARKRARIEQIKAFRKMKESKKTSSSSSIVAMLITVLFFVVIVLQGIFSGHSFTRKFQGSPAPATMNEGLFSIQLFNNAPTYEMNQPISLSPK